MGKKFKKLVVFDNIILTNDQLEKLKNCAEEVIFYSHTTDSKIIKERIKEADAIINCWTVLDENSLKGSKVKYIGNWGHWWKHRVVLSEERLKELGIHLDYIPDYGTDAVAEVAWAGILALSKNLEKWHRDAGAGRWTFENIKKGEKKVNIEEVEEQLISTKSLGIVGLGRIGYKIAKIGKDGFGMKVYYNSRTRKKDAEKKGIEFLPLKDLFIQCDIISIHVSPDAPENLISKELLNSMKSSDMLLKGLEKAQL